ncbi:ThuA domain-containing protein [Marinicella meishanensis]|uniref:ThuA domain-containing protein n=1 Tax=Marinicella meishanensis TaxID=2873263 RepID=UPI001CBB8596|nr:ThuA domain-containing protein [Marinicella sp. NBU2979]
MCHPVNAHETGTFNALIFSKTDGFRHGSIPAAQVAFQQMASEQGFTATFTEDSADFNTQNLAAYDVVVFLLTSGDVLNANEQQAFEAYIQNGGGFMGVHSASDTEYSWPWYGQLLGTYFDSHPSIQVARVWVEDNSHPATVHLDQEWMRTDEWYNFQTNPRLDPTLQIQVLMTLDETSYSGGNMGADHPISWYHSFQGGRSWYTGMGHTTASYAEPDFLAHLWGGLLYASGVIADDYLFANGFE